jgi:hypothetical protein
MSKKHTVYVQKRSFECSLNVVTGRVFKTASISKINHDVGVLADRRNSMPVLSIEH